MGLANGCCRVTAPHLPDLPCNRSLSFPLVANSQLVKRATIRKTFMLHYTSSFITIGYNIALEFTELYHIKKQTCHFFLSNIKYRNLCPSPGGCCQLPSFGTWRNGCSTHGKVQRQWPEDFLFKYTSYYLQPSNYRFENFFSFTKVQIVTFLPCISLPHFRCYLKEKRNSTEYSTFTCHQWRKETARNSGIEILSTA